MKHFRLFMTSLLCLTAMLARADDVGITEARLFEEEENRYALEVDISPYLVDAISPPVLPERGSFTDKEERVHLGQMLVVRYRFSTGDRPLDSNDQLLLPWQRTGAMVTAHWLDGKTNRTFFDRDLTGIPVPMSALRSDELTRILVLKNSVSDALSYLRAYWFLHLLLIVACAAQGSLRNLIRLLLAFAAGHGLSLIAADLGVPAVQSGYVPLLMTVAIILLSAAVVRSTEFKRYWPVLMTLGLLQGLGYSAPGDLVVARFGFNTTIDLVHVGMGLLVGLIYFALKAKVRLSLVYSCGALAAAALFFVFPTALEPVQNSLEAESLFVADQTNANSTRMASRPVELKDPVSGFVTITPFEVRCEWLIRARDFLDMESYDSESLKQSLMQRVDSAMEMTIDGTRTAPANLQADYVDVGTYGVTTRESPPTEELKTAVIGVSLAYPTDSAPQSVSVGFQPLGAIDSPVPVGMSDPWGSTPRTLTADNSTIHWTCQFAGFRRPIIPEVKLPSPTWPLASFILLIIASVLARRNTGWVVVICGLAVLLYPFARTPALWDFEGPDEADTRVAVEQLLTNIYRAFDYRTEEAIYDRLAISATGDQLADIYLEQMRAMELENRGGARASVDNVEVQAIHSVRSTDNGIDVDAEWLVSGSVSHFGHTHHRKNRYAAVLTLVDENGVWKIGGIEIKEEERVL